MEGKDVNKVEVIQLGCGFVGRIFKLKNNKLRNSSVHSLPMKATNNEQQKDINDSKVPSEPLPPKVDARKSTSSIHRAPLNSQNGRPSDAAARISIQQNQEPNGNTLELARISTKTTTSNTQQQPETETKSPTKEMKLTGNLLMNNSSPRTSVTNTPRKNKELNNNTLFSSVNNGVMGNIMRKSGDGMAQFRSPRGNRVDPEALKSMGNEAYKQGRFAEALALYEKAIALDSNKATYHCNKSAALIALGRFQLAIVECEEAIKLEPSYARPYARLATIYFRYSIL